jgi:hypothetical protein
MPYTKRELENLNVKYGSGWITNIQSTTDKQSYILYPTGYCTIDHGRDYVAIPTNTTLTQEDKRKLNII